MADENILQPKTLTEFQSILDQNRERLIVVDFYASWCSPCRGIAPKFSKLARENTNCVFLKIDVGEAEDIAALYDVRLMPTFVFIRNGKQVDSVEGSLEENLEKAILRHKKN